MYDSFTSGCGFDLSHSGDGKCREFCKSGGKRN
jgi:hypothetical protein